MLGIKLKRLTIGLALLALCGSHALAQEGDAKVRRHAAVRELVEVSGVQKYVVASFTEFVTGYQQNWADATIKDFKAKGLFNKLTPEDSIKMENVIRQFGDRAFDEVKRRVASQIATTDNLTALNEPTFERHFTADELYELLAFCKTPTGRKLLDEYHKVLAETAAAYLKSKGAFNVAPSPEAEMARVTRLQKDMGQELPQVIASAKIQDGFFTAAEIQELKLFYQTPLGVKLVKIYPVLVTEVLGNNARLYAGRVGQLTKDIFDEQMVWFETQTREVLKDYGPQGKRKPASN